MTEQTESLSQALDDHDVTLAMTTAQLLLALVGVWVLLRIIRSLRD
jgi:ABC-type uncharacterized transport system fused permease/ATPase subunit